MRYGSLFSGIGGLDLAVEAVFGAECAWQCEIDPFCRSVLAKHWPGVTCYEDVRTIEPGRTDLVCGGFPCQDVSSAGKGAGIEGPKSGLWREFERVIRVARPGVVIVENVTSGLRRWLATVLRDLATLGFDAVWETVWALEAGAPHRRARTFVLAYTDSELVREQCRRFQAGPSEAKSANIGETVADADGHSESASPVDAQASLLSRLAGHRWPPGPGCPPEDWTGPKPGIRRIDDGATHRVDRLKALGNGVVPQQAVLALTRMLERIDAHG